MSMRTKYLGSLLLFSSLASTAWAATYTVTTNADSGAGSLREAIELVYTFPDISNTINFNAVGTITLVTNLPPIVTPTECITTFNGNSVTISGVANQSQAFFVYRGNAVFNNLVLSTKALGGAGGVASGGGGGSAMGGGLFVKGGSSVTINTMQFTGCSAQGGAGGSGNSGGGGGGGIFGPGGSIAGSGGGGGGGTYAHGGNSSADVSTNASGGGGGGGFFPGHSGGQGDLGGGGGGGTVNAGIDGTSAFFGGNGGNTSGGGGGGGGSNVAYGGAAGGGGTNGGPSVTGVPSNIQPGGGFGGAGGAFGGGGGGGGGAIGGSLINGFGGIGGNGYPSGRSGLSDGGGGGGGGGSSQSTAGASIAGYGGGTGGHGGWGGGGGGAGKGLIAPIAGNGGFGGGGGGAAGPSGLGGNGGFGGGGGGTVGPVLPGASGGLFGGFGGGTISAGNFGGGGGGAGLGGAIFLQADALSGVSSLTIGDNCSLSGNTVVGGTGGVGIPSPASDGGAGFGLSPDIFMMSGTTLTVNVTAAPLTISNFIESDDTLFTQNHSTISGGGLIKTGANTLTLSGTPVFTKGYTGGTFIENGTIAISDDRSLGRDGITFNGGILQCTSTVNSSRDMVLETGGGTIDSNGQIVNLSGTISGIGALFAVDSSMGSGILQLLSPNTYSGGTIIGLSTTLIVTDDSALGATEPGTEVGSIMMNDSTLAFLNDSDPVISNRTIYLTGGDNTIETINELFLDGDIIDGETPGNITFSPRMSLTTVTITLRGNNSYSNGTVIANANLIGNTNSLQGDIDFAIGNLTFDQTFLGVYSGVITGPGSVLITNTGPVTFTGVNSYSEGTTVNAGANLQGNTVSLQGAITNNGNVIFNQQSPGTYAGLMSGTGTLTVAGVEPLTLSGANTYTGGTVINDGSSLIGDATSIQGDIADNGLLTFNQTVLGTYSGNISGEGAVNLPGAGELVMTGTNTYSGGTSIGLSTILSGTTDSIQGNIANQGLLVFNQTVFGLFAGNISGEGEVDITGAGPVFFSGSNSYSGSTFIDVPSALIGTTNSLQGTITNEGILVFAQGTTGIFSGSILGTGLVHIEGEGAVVFTLPNTYTGGTIIDSFSTLEGNTTNIQGAITNSGKVIFNQAFTGTYSGSQSIVGTYSGGMSGAGSVTIDGEGTVIFTGTNTYTGPTTVLNGTLVVNGSTTSPTIVNSGAFLKGTGVIGSSVSVTGTLRPGNSIGTLTVAGPVTFNTGSTYVEELSPAVASLLNVTAGSVTINPLVALSILPHVGVYPLLTPYTIIQATGGVFGIFSTVTNSFPAANFVVGYTPNTVFLIIEPVPLPNVIPSGNAHEVAKCVNSAVIVPGSDFASVVNQIIFAPTTESIKDALNQMQPSQFNALQLSQENTTTRLFSVLSNRMEQLYRPCKPSEKTWEMWTDGLVDFAKQKNQRAGQQNQYGFHTFTEGLALGVDDHASEHFHLGFGVAYTYSKVRWEQSHGNGHISSGYGTLYGTWHKPHFYIDASLIGAYNHYEVKRHIDFLNVDRHASNHHSGYTFAGELMMGAPIKIGRAMITPLISFDYDFLHQKGYHEHGANSLNLSVHSKNANLIRGVIGFKISRRCRPKCVQMEFANAVVKEPAVEKTVAAVPMVAEIVLAEPIVAAVIAEPVVKETMVEETVAAEPIDSEIVLADSMVEKTAVGEEPIVEELIVATVAAEPIVAETIVNQPLQKPKYQGFWGQRKDRGCNLTKKQPPVVEKKSSDGCQTKLVEKPVERKTEQGKTVAAEPIVAAVIAEPVVKEHVLKEPMVEEIVAAEPIDSEIVLADSMVEELIVATVAAEPIVAETVVNQPNQKPKYKGFWGQRKDRGCNFTKKQPPVVEKKSSEECKPTPEEKPVECKTEQVEKPVLCETKPVECSEKPVVCVTKPKECKKKFEVTWLPTFQLTAIQEWRTEGSHTHASFAGQSCVFSVEGFNPSTRTLISPAVGLTALLGESNVSISLDYVGEFSVDGKYWDQNGSLQISFSF